VTLREWLERGATQLAAGPHPEKARPDAQTLLLHQIGKNRAWLIAHQDEEFSGCGAIGYAALLSRRTKGEPIQYIVGECEFYGLPFRVSSDALIPRPETEHLVEAAVAVVKRANLRSAVDVGTGSGAIAVAMAYHLPQVSITATDLSAAALALAEQNAQRHGVSVRFLHGDLLVPVANEVFDLIVSNPPYVAERDRSSLAIEVRDYEPAQALFAGHDGLEIYRRIVPQALHALAAGGHILLEIGHNQDQVVGALLEESGFVDLEYLPDLQGIRRVVHAVRGKD
jgi:release factor glutamine methyltransferase